MKKTKEEILKYRKEYYLKNKDKWESCWKNRTIKRRIEQFGLDENKYNEMLTKQNGKCAICGDPPTGIKKSLCVDHDHKTGKIRSLLCDNCNNGLGRFRDSIKNLNKAIKYLIIWETNQK